MVNGKSARITAADKPVFYWQAANFLHSKKSNSWFLWLLLVALILVAIFVWLRLWTAAAVVIAAAFALYSQSHLPARKRHYAIYTQGVAIDDRVYTFDQFRSFWLFPYQGRTILRFEPAKRFAMPVEMPLEDQDIQQIRLFLSKHLPEEEERGEDIADMINRWIKF